MITLSMISILKTLIKYSTQLIDTVRIYNKNLNYYFLCLSDQQLIAFIKGVVDEWDALVKNQTYLEE